MAPPDDDAVPASAPAATPALEPAESSAHGRFAWRLACLATIAVPVLAYLPAIAGFVHYQPESVGSGIGHVTKTGYLQGFGFIDPNVGYNSQAIGHAAAMMWLHGHVPWWNLRSGLGMPLAASIQSAAFFPPTLLQALPNGSMWFHLFLAVMTGLATFALLRQLRCSPFAAAVGGIAFSLNGAAAWLTNAPANPMPFLPLCLLGVEYVMAASAAKRRGGWLVLAAGVVLSILGGFPEAAVFNFGLVAAWFVLRLIQHRKVAPGVLARAALGVGAGVLLAAPLLNAFVRLYKKGDVGLHVQALSALTLPRTGVSMFVSPYLFGSIFDNMAQPIPETWARIGGYAGVTMVVLAVGALFGPKDRWLRYLLGAWALLFLGSTFNLPVLHNVIADLPGLTHLAVYRYAPASALLCMVLLAAMCVDDLVRLAPSRAALRLAPGLALVVVCFVVGFFSSPRARAWMLTNLPRWYWGSIGLFCLIVGIIVVTCVLALTTRRVRGTAVAGVLGLLLVVELFGFFEVPILTWPRAVQYDTAPAAYLADHLGTQRYFTIGPLSPNYGAFYGIAQLDASDLPIPKNWSTYVHAKLNTCELPWQFGNGGPDLCVTPPLLEFLSRVATYEQDGVKYFVLGTKTVLTPYFQPRLDVQHQTPDGAVDMVLGWNPPSYFPTGILTSMTVDLSHGVPSGLRASVCSGGRCVDAVPAGPGMNGQVFRLASPLTLRGSLFMHLVASAADPVQVLTTPGSQGAPSSVVADGHALISCVLPKKHVGCYGRTAIVSLDYVPHSLPVQVLKTKYTQIFLLPHYSAIATAPGCRVDAHTMTSFTVHCTHASKLLYRELSYAGWAAHVNNTTTPITTVNGVYQRIDVPAGTSAVSFTYAPPDVWLTWLLALLGLLIVAGGVVWRLLGWTPPPPQPRGTLVVSSRRPRAASSEGVVRRSTQRRSIVLSEDLEALGAGTSTPSVDEPPPREPAATAPSADTPPGTEPPAVAGDPAERADDAVSGPEGGTDAPQA